MTRFLLGVGAVSGLWLAAVVPGCGDECVGGKERCNENAREVCYVPEGQPLGGGPYWKQEGPCGGPNPYCVLYSSGRTGCVAKPAPTPECPGADTSLCLQNVPASCREGTLVLGSGYSLPGDGVPCAGPTPICTPDHGCVAADAGATGPAIDGGSTDAAGAGLCADGASCDSG